MHGMQRFPIRMVRSRTDIMPIFALLGVLSAVFAAQGNAFGGGIDGSGPIGKTVTAISIGIKRNISLYYFSTL